LGGNSRDTLDFLQRYNAESAMDFDAQMLCDILTRGGHSVFFSGAMVDSELQWKDSEVNNFGIQDRARFLDFCGDRRWQKHMQFSRESNVEASTIFLNCTSIFLYSVRLGRCESPVLLQPYENDLSSPKPLQLFDFLAVQLLCRCSHFVFPTGVSWIQPCNFSTVDWLLFFRCNAKRLSSGTLGGHQR